MNSRTSAHKRPAIHLFNLVNRERFSAALLAVILFLIVTYAILINTTVLNIAEKQHTNSQLSELKQEIAELEVELIERESSITLERAQRQGFERLNSRTFVARDTNLSLRDE